MIRRLDENVRSVAVVTGALGNIGIELTRQCRNHFDRVIAIDRREPNGDQNDLVDWNNVEWCLGSSGNLSEYGQFTSLVEHRLRPYSSQEAEQLVVFHAAADVKTSSALRPTEALHNNVVMTLNILEEAINLSRKYSSISLTFVVFDSIGRVFVTSNSMNYSATKAAQRVFVRQLQTRNSSKVSIVNLYLGFDNSSTNSHIRFNWLKVPTESMVRQMLKAVLRRRSQVSIPWFRNAIISIFGSILLKFPPKGTARFEAFLKRVFSNSGK